MLQITTVILSIALLAGQGFAKSLPNKGVPNCPDIVLTTAANASNYVFPIHDDSIIRKWQKAAKEHCKKAGLSRIISKKKSFVCGGDYIYECNRMDNDMKGSQTFMGYKLGCHDKTGEVFTRCTEEAVIAMCNSHRRLKTQESVCVDDKLFYCPSASNSNSIRLANSKNIGSTNLACKQDKKDFFKYNVRITPSIIANCFLKESRGQTICVNGGLFKCPTGEPTTHNIEYKAQSIRCTTTSKKPTEFSATSLIPPYQDESDQAIKDIPAGIQKMCKSVATPPFTRYCVNKKVYTCRKVGPGATISTYGDKKTSDVSKHDADKYENCDDINARNDFYYTNKLMNSIVIQEY